VGDVDVHGGYESPLFAAFSQEKNKNISGYNLAHKNSYRLVSPQKFMIERGNIRCIAPLPPRSNSWVVEQAPSLAARACPSGIAAMAAASWF
jgi:hypothetical protein